jgi:hypothetical protein
MAFSRLKEGFDSPMRYQFRFRFSYFPNLVDIIFNNFDREKYANPVLLYWKVALQI